MQTPQDIQEKKFTKALIGGYDMTEVDEFLDAVVSDYTALFKENAVLKSKMKVLVNTIEEYRSVDDAMRKALLSAQQMANEMTEDAKAKSSAMIETARAEAEKEILDLKGEAAEEERRLRLVKQKTSDYAAEVMAACNAHIAAIQGLLESPVPEESKNSVEAAAKEIEQVLAQAELVMDFPDIAETLNLGVPESPGPQGSGAPVAPDSASRVKILRSELSRGPVGETSGRQSLSIDGMDVEVFEASFGGGGTFANGQDPKSHEISYLEPQE